MVTVCHLVFENFKVFGRLSLGVQLLVHELVMLFAAPRDWESLLS